METIKLYLKLVGISIRSQMQYRTSFVIMTLGLAVVTLIEFLAIWVLFERFGSLRSWSLPEVGMFYGLAHSSFAIAVGLARGFDIFHRQVVDGKFDRVLLRPQSTVLQILGQQIQLLRLGRLSQGLVILLWACMTLEIQWTVYKGALLLFAILGGVMLFTGILIIQATFSFWSVQGVGFMNAFTHGGVQMGQYPLAIFRGWLRKFFLFIIPLGCTIYFPVLLIIGRQDPLGTSPLFQALSPLAGLLFLLLSLQIWRFGIRRYQSTGS